MRKTVSGRHDPTITNDSSAAHELSSALMFFNHDRPRVTMRRRVRAANDFFDSPGRSAPTISRKARWLKMISDISYHDIFIIIIIYKFKNPSKIVPEPFGFDSFHSAHLVPFQLYRKHYSKLSCIQPCRLRLRPSKNFPHSYNTELEAFRG